MQQLLRGSFHFLKYGISYFPAGLKNSVTHLIKSNYKTGKFWYFAAFYKLPSVPMPFKQLVLISRHCHNHPWSQDAVLRQSYGKLVLKVFASHHKYGLCFQADEEMLITRCLQFMHEVIDLIQATVIPMELWEDTSLAARDLVWEFGYIGLLLQDHITDIIAWFLISYCTTQCVFWNIWLNRRSRIILKY